MGKFINWFNEHISVIVAIFLGITSVWTAYASFEASLYGSSMAKKYNEGTKMVNEANSAYLEANQIYIKDAQLEVKLMDLMGDQSFAVDTNEQDKATAKYDYFLNNSASDMFKIAFQWSIDNSDDNNEYSFSQYPGDDTNPSYNDYLYSECTQKKADGEAMIEQGNADNTLGDKMTLSTVLYALVLFLLGVVGTMKAGKSPFWLTVFSFVIFIAAVVQTVSIPIIMP